MIILDTNVVSVMMQPDLAPEAMTWLSSQETPRLWTTTVTYHEIRFGLLILPMGRRRQALERAFALLLNQGFRSRIFDFDQAAAEQSARLAAQHRSQGLGFEHRDLQIAGIASAKGASLATRNARHFEHAGIPLINPWSA